MGVKLDDIVGKKKNVLEDKSKKTVNLLLIAIVIIVIVIVILAIRVYQGNQNRQLQEHMEKLLNDATTLSQAVGQRYLQVMQGDNNASYQGTALDSNNYRAIGVGNQTVKFESGYYYLSADDANTLAPNLNLKNIDYVVNYITGEVINLQGLNYNGKNYYFEEDLRAVRELLNGRPANIPSDSTFFINNADDMLKMKEYPNYTFKLCNEIDMSSIKDWPAIEFSGRFDGRSYNISNLTINKSADERVGLFSEIKPGAVITNVYLSNVDINGGKYTGALAGILDQDANVENCGVWSGKVTGSSECVGGVFGLSSGNVKTVVSRCEVSANGNNVGGFAGRVVNGNYEKVAVKGDGNAFVTIYGTYNVGGLIGLIEPTGNIAISESCAWTNIIAGTEQRAVIGEKDASGNFRYNAGGFIGAVVSHKSGMNLSIENAYVRGQISKCDKNLGGFLGLVSVPNGGNIDLHYIYSAVNTNALGEGEESRGGFVGCWDTRNCGGGTIGVYWQRDNYMNMDLLADGYGIIEQDKSYKPTFQAKSQGDLRNSSIFTNLDNGSEIVKKWNFKTYAGNLPTLAWE